MATETDSTVKDANPIIFSHPFKMNKAGYLVSRATVMLLVSHLKRPSGDKGHENGAETSLSQLRGSAAIGQLSDICMSLERNQQAAKGADITTVRVLKNRWSGETGIACHLEYDRDTGRMTEVAEPQEAEEMF